MAQTPNLSPTNTLSLQGQWLGRYAGTNSGSLVLDIDDVGSGFDGVAQVFDDNPQLPGSWIGFKTLGKTSDVTVKVPVIAVHPQTRHPLAVEQLIAQFPEITFPTDVTVRLKRLASSLRVSWATNIGTNDSGVLPISKSNQKSRVPVIKSVKSWGDFREFALSLASHDYIFRGQDGPYRLRTTFHRRRRANLHRLMAVDIPALHRHLSGRTKHVFNLNDPLQNAAFYNLVQHHGYPTSLLDWTYSPFVAAYFAYRRYGNSESDAAGKVRIYVFDKKNWLFYHPQFHDLINAPPHFSILEALGIENDRMVPQQALSTVTNIDDIENHVQDIEKNTGCQYLRAIDLPVSERGRVIRDLSAMGVSAGSLFPGIDGACEELRERFFP